MQLRHVFSLANRLMKKPLLVIVSAVLSFGVLMGSAPAFAQAAKVYADKITLSKGKTLSLSLVLATKGEERKIEKCTITIATHTQNADGSRREEGSNYFGYDIAVASNGSFSQVIPSGHLVAGTVTAKGIKGSVKIDGKKYAYSAKEGASTDGGASSVGGPGVYRSIERSNLLADPSNKRNW